LTGGDSSGKAQANNDDGSPKKPKRKVAAVKPGNVTVAVLNGTTVPGLAAALREQIAAAGFKKGMIDVFSDQQLAESVVQYAPGHQAEAKAVSRTLAINQREPITANSRALAGDATVIVIAGADKAP
jgi:siroheme synthase (precorrin-2 oxidase/ferrochelatase)